jgi:ATP-binding cassette subfamily F protein 3
VVSSYADRKAEQKRKNKIEKRRKELEQKIEQLEEKKKELDELLMLPENAANMQMVTDYTNLQAELDKLEEEYFNIE